jgi:hypothetical protein
MHGNASAARPVSFVSLVTGFSLTCGEKHKIKIQLVHDRLISDITTDLLTGLIDKRGGLMSDVSMNPVDKQERVDVRHHCGPVDNRGSLISEVL